MPGLDGIEVAAELSRTGPPVPVVLLSAFDERALIRRGIEAGAVAFIAKDADRDEILGAVRAAAASMETAAARPDLRGVSLPRLSEDELWLLRLADVGMLDRSNISVHAR